MKRYTEIKLLEAAGNLRFDDVITKKGDIITISKKKLEEMLKSIGIHGEDMDIIDNKDGFMELSIAISSYKFGGEISVFMFTKLEELFNEKNSEHIESSTIDTYGYRILVIFKKGVEVELD